VFILTVCVEHSVMRVTQPKRNTMKANTLYWSANNSVTLVYANNFPTP